MKNFLFNTPIGVTITIIVISMITILLSTTITLVIWGGGIRVFNDLAVNDVINSKILNTCTTIWTLLNIVIFILVTIWLWLELMMNVNSKWNLDEKED